MDRLIILDQNLLISISKLTNKSGSFNFIVASIAQYLIYSVPIVLIVMWFWPSYDNLKKLNERRALISALLSGLLAWFAINQPLIYVFHRARPNLALLNKQELFFHRPDFSFPSDHASLLFGITFYLYFTGEHKKGHLFLIIAVLVSISRVISAVHFPLDILAGAAVGLIAAVIVKLFDKYLIKVWDYLIKILEKIKLA